MVECAIQFVQEFNLLKNHQKKDTKNSDMKSLKECCDLEERAKLWQPWQPCDSSKGINEG